MSTTISVEEAQAKLKELIHELASGEKVTITEDQQPVATLVGTHPPRRKPRVPGNCKGMITLLVEDDEHLDGFAEYLP
jgi:antitoxin (DNA-binding transcriptional repressor) of toxin-antitoxin stability system